MSHVYEKQMFMVYYSEKDYTGTVSLASLLDYAGMASWQMTEWNNDMPMT